MTTLTHLQRLEAESIHILREVYEALYLRGPLGRLNQLASMNRPKTTNMMMRMFLISMAVPLRGKGWG